MIKPGDLLCDNYGREGIAIEQVPSPDAEWLEQQEDRRMVELRGSIWWKVIPLTGGLVTVPESLSHLLRPAGPADRSKALTNANEFGVRLLKMVFPDT